MAIQMPLKIQEMLAKKITDKEKNEMKLEMRKIAEEEIFKELMVEEYFSKNDFNQTRRGYRNIPESEEFDMMDRQRDMNQKKGESAASNTAREK